MRSAFLSWQAAFFVFLFACLLLALATRATAQPQSATQRLAGIRAEMEQGQALYVAGNYAGAAQIFEAGYTTYPYSAFLFNAGVCYQKLNDADRAIAKFKEYERVDPNAPDIDKVNQRIAALQAAQLAVDAGPKDAGAEDAGAEDAGIALPGPAKPPIALPSTDDQDAMKSLVMIETEPDGAPLRIYQRTDSAALPFRLGATNPGWKEVAATRAPANLTLDVGHYHVVVEKFRDFNSSEADMDVSPGHVHQLKANLSQGQFMAFLRVSANVIGAHVWVDDEKKQHSEWGETPHGELIPGGAHVVLVEVPGFEPLLANVKLQHGEQKELEVRLVRVGYGVLRLDSMSSAPEIKVSIDNQAKGVWRSGEEPLDVRSDSGSHLLTITSDGRKTFEGMVLVPRGEVLPLHATMIPKFPRGPAWTQTVIGAALLGGAVYAGLESNQLHDQLQRDRQNGSLESDDSRATRGKIFAIGADAGFALAGVFGAMATYNFVRDPLPESSIKRGKLVEFEDPLKRRPVAWRPLPPPSRSDVARERRGSTLELSPRASSRGVGLFLGGNF